ncbi:type II toxin-antitoxin system Phd/YefM family antitoxin [Microbacterium terrisoli]|uniref:type II toxin-antitoxin system Phd/YefM family antitoxin n=1 Tax=Microbacterium terrisoli TaxID=3242192 RepID=UPI002804D04F|nr:type II toxin-antitoxin system prevent-host-death family antitoxin [Microbacterium protaetiae]
MATISASEARQTLPAQLDRVEKGEEVEITRHGRVVAVLVNPTTLATRRARRAWQEADEIGDLLEAARKKPIQRVALGAGRAEELVADIRNGRDTR